MDDSECARSAHVESSIYLKLVMDFKASHATLRGTGGGVTGPVPQGSEGHPGVAGWPGGACPSLLRNAGLIG